MTDTTAEHQVAAPASVYDELPDAPPKRKLKFTVVGKIAITIVTFWVVLAFLGPFISPYHEADIIADDSFTEPGEVCSVYEEGFCSYHILGTDYLGRDTLSRILWGARTTIGVSFIATIIAYIVGVILGIGAAVGGNKLDMGLSRGERRVHLDTAHHVGTGDYRGCRKLHTDSHLHGRVHLLDHRISYFPGAGAGCDGE